MARRKVSAQKRTIELPNVSKFDPTTARKKKPTWKSVDSNISSWICPQTQARIDSNLDGTYLLTTRDGKTSTYPTMIDAANEGEREERR